MKFISACFTLSGTLTLIAACGGAPGAPVTDAPAALTASSRRLQHLALARGTRRNAGSAGRASDSSQGPILRR